MAGKFDHDQNPMRAGTPLQYRGPRSLGVKAFGWFGSGANVRSWQRVTITRTFHGPRRDC